MATKPISKKQTLTGTLTALGDTYTFGIELVNTTGADLEYTLNGGDTIKLPTGGKEYYPEVINPKEVTVKGSGDIYYIIFQSR